MNDNTQKNKKTGSNAAYAAGGFVAGAAAGSAATAVAKNFNSGEQDNAVIETQPQNEVEEIETVTQQPQQPQNEVTEELEEIEMVVETSLYAPIAHVSDNLTFAQAFAEARRQVGPGGVFEWRGNVYGTYYATEWEQMSAAERAEYHSHIDYQAAHAEHQVYFGNEQRPTPTQNSDDGKVKSNEEKIDIDPDEPVKVISIQQVDCEFGKDGKAIIAEITIDGQEAVLMDLNNDGHFDALLADLDNDGLLSENEIIDIRNWNVDLADLAEKYDGKITVVINEPYEPPLSPVDDSNITYYEDYHNDEEFA